MIALLDSLARAYYRLLPRPDVAGKVGRLKLSRARKVSLDRGAGATAEAHALAALDWLNHAEPAIAQRELPDTEGLSFLRAINFVTAAAEAAFLANLTNESEVYARLALQGLARIEQDESLDLSFVDTGQRRFELNLLLTRVALHRGDAEAATQFMLAACELPPTAKVSLFAASEALDDLLAKGFTKTALEFLERCRPHFGPAGRLEEDWISELRRGVAPRIFVRRR